MIHVVRHAHAGSRAAWRGDDRLRPLSQRGRMQAKLVAEALGAPAGAPLLSSPFVRCMQTLEPLAARGGTEVVGDDRLAEGSAPEPLVALLRTLGDGAVLCSHGDVITTLVGHLAAGGTRIDPRVDTQKGGVWSLELGGSRVVAGVYTPPPRT